MQGLRQLNSKDFDGYSEEWSRATFEVHSI
jgi:hypothetical protein